MLRLNKEKNIFRSVFLPVFTIMVLQSIIFYVAAVYGGIEDSLRQNAAAILTERMMNRKIELETQLNGRSFELASAETALENEYTAYEQKFGSQPLADSSERQIEFLSENADLLIQTLRHNEVNGIFLILNNAAAPGFSASGVEKYYGLNIRDMDQNSSYIAREDLALDRSPSSIVDELGCALDSWWEAMYSFTSEADGDFFYYPLNAAWDHPQTAGKNLAYFSGPHHVSGNDPEVVSYSIPLVSKDGYPFGVLGVELTTKYLSSLIPVSDFSDKGESCYVLATRSVGTYENIPVAASGSLYTRSFASGSTILSDNAESAGGFSLFARDKNRLYGDDTKISIYNNNSPFDDQELALLVLAAEDTMFAYISHVKNTLLLTSIFCLALGIIGIFWTSRNFAKPIKTLAEHVRNMNPKSVEKLERIGVQEIDQLVDAIEELNQKVNRSSARTEFFSRMSHDMRTPMNAIIGFSSPELLEDADEAIKDDYLQKIHASGDYLLGLINDVLDMTKIESNKLELSPATVKTQNLCDTTLPIITNLADSKGVKFENVFFGDPNLSVMVDISRFDQILLNLLSNAVKFTPKNGIIKLSLTAQENLIEPQKIDCKIVVSDSGIGMSNEFQKRLYTPFEQENASGAGTGLGLSIVRRLVELMDGSITCISQKGEGTTFIVDLSLARSFEQNKGPSEKTSAEVFIPEFLRNKTVLICEDNEMNVQIICRLLEKVGVITDVVQNGEECVKKFENSAPNTYNAILMDIRMPVMDGLTATRVIRSMTRPDAKEIPIIALTADAFSEDVQVCHEAGMNAHLSKPIDTRNLFELLNNFFRPGN